MKKPKTEPLLSFVPLADYRHEDPQLDALARTLSRFAVAAALAKNGLGPDATAPTLPVDDAADELRS